jgi:hypothetical protein
MRDPNDDLGPDGVSKPLDLNDLMEALRDISMDATLMSNHIDALRGDLSEALRNIRRDIASLRNFIGVCFFMILILLFIGMPALRAFSWL